MARYTGLFVVAAPFDGLRSLLADVLKSCNFDVIYDTNDYLVAKEAPGSVKFTKLVTVEVLIDPPKTVPENIRMNFVVKNEELALQLNNHCYQRFEDVKQAVADSHYWTLVESVM
jgi:hypothetical protein